jgi:CHAT domain-containing protein
VWDRLPGTATEARAVGPLLRRYTGAEPSVHTGADAGEGVVKSARRPRALVLATHGYFLPDPGAPAAGPGGRGIELVEGPAPGRGRGAEGRLLENPLLRCGLVLAGANRRADRADRDGDDGLLTGLEVVGCDLRGCELVVLSACETGLGETPNGEGVAGLRQAFQLAGARRVVASLWMVPDRETTALMTGFFRHLADGAAHAEALRQAQREVIAARRRAGGAAHPFYWAAFTCTGPDR